MKEKNARLKDKTILAIIISLHAGKRSNLISENNLIDLWYLKKKKTWLPVSIELSIFPLAVFQNRMHRSAVPPPDARSPCWCGDHAMALTAAVCSVRRRIGCWVDLWFHTNSCFNWLKHDKSYFECSKFEKFAKRYKDLKNFSLYLIIISTWSQFTVVMWPLQSTHLTKIYTYILFIRKNQTMN